MRRFGICCCAVVLIGCGKTKSEPATDQQGRRLGQEPPERRHPRI